MASFGACQDAYSKIITSNLLPYRNCVEPLTYPNHTDLVRRCCWRMQWSTSSQTKITLKGLFSLRFRETADGKRSNSAVSRTLNIVNATLAVWLLSKVRQVIEHRNSSSERKTNMTHGCLVDKCDWESYVESYMNAKLL